MKSPHGLSRVEVVVLARMSHPKKPSNTDLVKAVADLAGLERTKEQVAASMAILRQHELVDPKREVLTAAGGAALGAAFGLDRRPTWVEVRDELLPAKTLGRKSYSEVAALLDKKFAETVLAWKYNLAVEPELGEVCDALIAKRLGLPPGPLTLTLIRAHVLAQQAEVAPTGALKAVASRAASKLLGAGAGKRGIIKALARQWVREGAPAHPLPVQPLLPLPPVDLLSVVQDTLPRVDASGRFGAEKVFVSAIWHSLDKQQNLGVSSLADFKKWLLQANRKRELMLARADMAPAMDQRLVTESEIEDQGSTFHFVLDRRPAVKRVVHAR